MAGILAFLTLPTTPAAAQPAPSRHFRPIKGALGLVAAIGQTIEPHLNPAPRARFNSCLRALGHSPYAAGALDRRHDSVCRSTTYRAPTRSCLLPQGRGFDPVHECSGRTQPAFESRESQTVQQHGRRVFDPHSNSAGESVRPKGLSRLPSPMPRSRGRGTARESVIGQSAAPRPGYGHGVVPRCYSRGCGRALRRPLNLVVLLIGLGPRQPSGETVDPHRFLWGCGST